MNDSKDVDNQNYTSDCEKKVMWEQINHEYLQYQICNKFLEKYGNHDHIQNHLHHNPH